MIQTDIRDLTATLANWWPSAPEMVTVRPLPANSTVILIEIASECPHRASVMLRCLDLMTVRDMIAGKYSARDTTLYLHVRGFLPGGHPVIVTAPFDEATDHRQAQLIDSEIDAQQPAALITRLVAIEADCT